MLKKLFSSNTRIKLLQLLMFNPSSEYYLREIARKIKISPIYTSKELNNLLKAELVKKTTKGNLTIYSINQQNPILEDLKSIFKKTR